MRPLPRIGALVLASALLTGAQAQAESLRFQPKAAPTPAESSHSGLRLMFGGTNTTATETTSATRTGTKSATKRTTASGLTVKTKNKTVLEEVEVEEDVVSTTVAQHGQQVEARRVAGMMALRQWASANVKQSAVQKSSSLLDHTQALQILRGLSKDDLTFLIAIPQQAVVTCGNGAPAQHLISSKIPNQASREALRNWVKGGGDWRAAVQAALDERT